MELVPLSKERQSDIVIDFARKYGNKKESGVYSYGWQMMPYGRQALVVILTEEALWSNFPAEFAGVEVYYRKARREQTELTEALRKYHHAKVEKWMTLMHEFMEQYKTSGMLGFSLASDDNDGTYLNVMVCEGYDTTELPTEFKTLPVKYQVSKPLNAL